MCGSVSRCRARASSRRFYSAHPSSAAVSRDIKSDRKRSDAIAVGTSAFGATGSSPASVKWSPSRMTRGRESERIMQGEFVRCFQIVRSHLARKPPKQL